jgi:hypothetical protein
MKPLPILLSVIAFGLATGSATAQVPWYRPGVVVPYGYGYGAYAGGYSPYSQQGMADIIRSSGQAAENLSRARINNEEARSKYLDNKLKWTEIYWQRKRLGEAELAKDYAKDRARREQWQEATRGRKPETLSPSQFDAQTGGLEWPDALQGPIYADYRKRIEAELELQATTGTNANAGTIRNIAREMQNVLKNHIREMSSNEYIAARKFLDRLVNQMAMTQTTT